MTIRANRIERYYDSHRRDDEELSQSFPHQAAIHYLMLVLTWLFHNQKVGIAQDINFYVTPDPREHCVSPDLAVVDGLVIVERAIDDPNSYYVGADGPPPRVIFEVSSKDTWSTDLDDKPARYAAMGVSEYFAFDPHQPTYWTRERKKAGRLLGWRMNAAGQYDVINKREDGWMWSEQLDSWLAMDKGLLRLYTREGQLRIDEAGFYRQEAELERQQAYYQREQAAKQQQELETLRQKLRELGQDPDKL